MALPISLDPSCCRERQKWLSERMRQEDVDCAVLLSPEHVQYLTGFLPHRLMAAIVCLDRQGECTLVAPNDAPEEAAADQVLTYEAQWLATLRQEQVAAASAVLGERSTAAGKARRLAVEASRFPLHLNRSLGLSSQVEMIDIEPELWNRRRHKDADELAMIRRAIDCTQAMYQRAREIVVPGISELQVFNELHAAAVEVAGEPLTALGNDYQANSPGGPPRDRQAQAGELMILDLGPAYRGYYADNCRTLAVDGTPASEQETAWRLIVETLDMVAETVRPGVACRELFQRAQSMLDQYRSGAFFHHLGHGFGLFPHEAPHLNPNWDDVFREGDTFTAEPGLYGPELRAGIRLEQNYRVTAGGVELLTDFPLEL